MGSKEEAGKRCPAAGGVSSFTIQSILGGGPSEAPREPAGWPARKRSLSVSSEEEEPDDGWKAPACFCPDPLGPQEPGPKHRPPIPFPCLGKDRAARELSGREMAAGLARPPGWRSPGRRRPGSEGRERAPGAPTLRGVVLGQVGLEGECTSGGARSRPHAALPQYPQSTSTLSYARCESWV